MLIATLFDMRGAPLAGHVFQNAEVNRIGPVLVRQNYDSPNPCRMANARTHVVFTRPKGVLAMEAVGSPVLVRIMDTSDLAIAPIMFWIPPYKPGDRGETDADVNALQRGMFTFTLPTFIY